MTNSTAILRSLRAAPIVAAGTLILLATLLAYLVTPTTAAPRQEVRGDEPLKVKLLANDLAYDPVRGLLYAAVASTADDKANTITAIDPKTGTIRWSVNVGSDPAVLVISGDARVLWVGLRGASSIQRFDLEARKPGPLLPLGGAVFAETMAVIPGTTDSVVVSFYSKGISPRHGGVAVYDNGKRRDKKTRGHTGSNRIAYTNDPAVLFGYNNETTEFGLRKLTVDQDGIREEKVYGGVIQGFGVDLIHGGGRLYSTNGAVVDTKDGSLAGTIPAKGLVTFDATRRRVYCLTSGDGKLQAIDPETLTRTSSYTLPNGTQVSGSLVAMSGVGVAFRTPQHVLIVPLKHLPK